MPKTFNFSLKSKKDDLEEPVSATFEDDELSRFADYYQYCEELCETQAIKDGFQCSFNMSYEAGHGTKFSPKLPPDSDVIVVLHKLRPLILYNEPTNYYNIASIVGRRIAHSGVRAFLKSQRDLYSGKQFQSQIQMTFKDAGSKPVVVNSEKVLFDWLNANEYHRAPDAKASINALYTMLPEQASRAVFLHVVSDMVVAIVNLAEFLGLFLGKRSSMNFGL
jgi:hypothetical protein